MTPEERAQAVLAALPASREGVPTLEWFQDGIDFRIYDSSITDDGAGVSVVVEAEDINGSLPLDNPYRFFNPPLGIVTQDAVYDQDGTLITERVVDYSDPLAAFQNIVYEAVVFRAQQLGWSP